MMMRRGKKVKFDIERNYVKVFYLSEANACVCVAGWLVWLVHRLVDALCYCCMFLKCTLYTPRKNKISERASDGDSENGLERAYTCVPQVKLHFDKYTFNSLILWVLLYGWLYGYHSTSLDLQSTRNTT